MGFKYNRRISCFWLIGNDDIIEGKQGIIIRCTVRYADKNASTIQGCCPQYYDITARIEFEITHVDPRITIDVEAVILARIIADRSAVHHKITDGLLMAVVSTAGRVIKDE